MFAAIVFADMVADASHFICRSARCLERTRKRIALGLRGAHRDLLAKPLDVRAGQYVLFTQQAQEALYDDQVLVCIGVSDIHLYSPSFVEEYRLLQISQAPSQSAILGHDADVVLSRHALH